MANEVYLNRGTAVTWKVSGGDEAIDLGSANGAADGVEVGSYHDWTAAPQPDEYEWTLDVDGFDTAPVVGETVDMYITESADASLWTGPEAPSDTLASTGNTDRLKNLQYVGSAVVRSVTAANNLTAGGIFRSSRRYFAPVIHNNTADKLLSSGDAHQIIITPIYYQGQ